MPTHISDDLLQKLDRALGKAIRDVEDGKAQKAKVSLAFTVGHDKEGDLTVVYEQKAGDAVGGSWQPSSHPRLPLGDEERPGGGIEVDVQNRTISGTPEALSGAMRKATARLGGAA